jgi:hypothetical protein
MGDVVVTEATLTQAIDLAKDNIQSDIDHLISSVNEVNQSLTNLSAKMDDHMKKAELEAGNLRQEKSRLNTKIDNVQSQLLDKQGHFSSSASGSSFGPPPPPLVHKLCFPKYDGSDDPLTWLHKCEQFFRSQGMVQNHQVCTAAFYLEGPANQWYFCLEKNHGEPS